MNEMLLAIAGIVLAPTLGGIGWLIKLGNKQAIIEQRLAGVEDKQKHSDGILESVLNRLGSIQETLAVVLNDIKHIADKVDKSK